MEDHDRSSAAAGRANYLLFGQSPGAEIVSQKFSENFRDRHGKNTRHRSLSSRSPDASPRGSPVIDRQSLRQIPVAPPSVTFLAVLRWDSITKSTSR